MLKEGDTVYIASQNSVYLDSDVVALIARDRRRVHLHSKGCFSLRINGGYFKSGETMGSGKWLKHKGTQRNVAKDDLQP